MSRHFIFRATGRLTPHTSHPETIMLVMTNEVLTRLKQPYSTDETPPGVKFDTAIGVELPEVDALFTTVDADMDTANHGIGWWVGHPLSDRRRILIADHLLQCVRGIERNVVDARLHQLCAEHCFAEEARFNRELVRIRQDATGQQRIEMKHPERQSAADDLARSLGDTHTVGFFRAIGSALDCLAGAIIGVLAIPQNIVLADLVRLRGWLGRLQADSSATTQLQTAYHRYLEGLIRTSGPQEWLDWALGMRNMFVHRARRLQLGSAIPRDTGLIDGSGKPMVLTRTGLQLPCNPLWSDVEVFSDPAFEPVLSEDALATIVGVFDSTTALVEQATAALRRAWVLRRNSPASVTQPDRQWPEIPNDRVLNFPGYQPGSQPYNPAVLSTNPGVVRRLRVAALADNDRHKWSTFS